MGGKNETKKERGGENGRRQEKQKKKFLFGPSSKKGNFGRIRKVFGHVTPAVIGGILWPGDISGVKSGK
jgi:hypothetical protein